MRLDKYLKVSRIVKRRTVANELCDAKHVSVNGKVARASLEIKEGDVIEVSAGGAKRQYKVLKVAENATKEGAADLFEAL
ncbi:MAG TPA: RNA-binding S4 domain-containing protein [Clostridiales bacterium]|nr:MAG: 30S ribosomal protein S4 [Firmicutes bacterium ADurb.Bin262]HOU10934.1 RNA-binding S4 domain-containing protein [Clostridiales bacterium]HQH63432.1 RNA-binding S4 domain-containing protein [Clostridiales bacterium]HQK72947.1 RNA-binding S4 domain-containing protein [Clostridiales bacterium]